MHDAKLYRGVRDRGRARRPPEPRLAPRPEVRRARRHGREQARRRPRDRRRRGAVCRRRGRRPRVRGARSCRRSAVGAALELGIGACSVVRCGHAGRAGAWVERAVGHGTVGNRAPRRLGPTVRDGGGAGNSCKPPHEPHRDRRSGRRPAAGPRHGDEPRRRGEGRDSRVPRDNAPRRGDRRPGGETPHTRRHFYDGGSLLPAAGHKGFGLAAMVEALSVSLTGAAESRPAEGALVICIDAGGFRPASDVRASVEALRSRLHASGRECGVLAPGEPEARARDGLGDPGRDCGADPPPPARIRGALMGRLVLPLSRPNQGLGVAGVRAPRVGRAQRRRIGRPAPQANAIVCTGDDVELLRQSLLPDMRWVQLGAAGIEMWLDAGVMQPDIVWTAAKGVYARPIAEHVLALILAAARGLPERARARSWGSKGRPAPRRGDGWRRRRGWDRSRADRASRPARGSHDGAYARRPSVPGADVSIGPRAVAPPARRERLRRSDCRPDGGNGRMISAESLALMRPDAWLINVARGWARRDGRTRRGPPDRNDRRRSARRHGSRATPADHPLWTLPNVLITPHVASTRQMGLRFSPAGHGERPAVRPRDEHCSESSSWPSATELARPEGHSGPDPRLHTLWSHDWADWYGIGLDS